MIMSQERMILKGQAQLEEVTALVRRCSRDARPIDEVQRELWQSVLALGRTLLASYVEGVGSGDVGETLVHAGRKLRRLMHASEKQESGTAGGSIITNCSSDGYGR